MRLFLFIPFCICIGYLPFFYVKWYNKLISISLIFIVSFFVMKSTITGSYKYIPYSNYLFEFERNFQERSNYNMINSPYKNNDKSEKNEVERN